MRENAIKPAFLLSFGCIYEKSCLISCGLGAAARVLGHNGPKVLLLEIILTKSSKGPKSYRLSVYCFSNFFLQIQDQFRNVSCSVGEIKVLNMAINASGTFLRSGKKLLTSEFLFSRPMLLQV